MVREPDFVDECYADKDLSLLKKLTLVIPTYNRNFYLSRCLWYHAHFPFGQIIVADSSPEEKKVVNKETIEKIREMFGADILYLEYEPETEKYGGDIYRKWGDAVQHVDTEYSVICTDKEFLIASTLSKFIYFMDYNPEYISIDGKKYLVSCNKNNARRVYQKAYPHRTSENKHDGYQRYCHSLSVGIWDNVLTLELMRTYDRQKLFKYYVDYDVCDLRYGEMLLGYIPHIIGYFRYEESLTVRVRDVITLVKEIQNGVSTSKESSSSRYPSFYDYVLEGDEKVVPYCHYKMCVLSYLQDNTKLNPDCINTVVEMAKPSNMVKNSFSTKSGFTHKLALFYRSSVVIDSIIQHIPINLLMRGNILLSKMFGFTIPLYYGVKNLESEIHVIDRLFSLNKGDK